MRTAKLAALGVVGALALTACNGDNGDPASPAPTDTGTDAAAPPATLEVTATDDGEGGGYAFELPDAVPAGATEISLRNTGAEPHHAQLFKLNADKTMEDVGAALATGEETALFEVGLFDGGTGGVDPGGSSTANGIADLSAGTYAFLCFFPNDEGVPHLALGMVQDFEVTANDDAPAAPTADAEVGLVDYAFELPATIAGDATLNVVNRTEAGEPHEMNILNLAEGATAADVFAFIDGTAEPGPPPFSMAGGMQALLPGGSQLLQLDLEAGSYLFLCFIPSVLPENEGASHAELGMVMQVEIA